MYGSHGDLMGQARPLNPGPNPRAAALGPVSYNVCTFYSNPLCFFMRLLIGFCKMFTLLYVILNPLIEVNPFCFVQFPLIPLMSPNAA